MVAKSDIPIYIPSKSRADTATTMGALNDMGVPYTIIVESQWKAYAEVYGKDRLLVLDPAYQRDYDTLDEFGDQFSKGSGAARNMGWDHAQANGHDWHWIIDDNIRAFMRANKNVRLRAGSPVFFNAMEDFAQRYTNTAMLGPQYVMFAPSKNTMPPFITGTRVYSCNLIRTSLPFRWRGRYNEDTILSLDMLKAGWATVLFNAFQADKLMTQKVGGGNTEAFYAAKGTYPKSQMLVAAHPDVARLTFRFSRVHHYVDYSRWLGQPLLRDPSWVAPEVNPYRERVVGVTDKSAPAVAAFVGAPDGE